eukprot:843736_1
MVRIKYSYTSKWRIWFWTSGAYMFYVYALDNHHIERTFRNDISKRVMWVIDMNYEEWKRRERWRWSEYLRNWDPLTTGNTGRGNMGYLSSSVFDKWFYGNRKFQDPPPYTNEADQFICLAEKSGLDPAGPLMDSITKMVDYYYPSDLDDTPDDTKQVKEPHVQWIYKSNFDDIVEEEDKKPKHNTLARYLWFVPGYSEYYDNLKMDARNQEEKFLLNSNSKERTIFYEETDRLSQRWALELNDYAPLLAKRWDKKHKFAKYVMDSKNKQSILEAIKKPGGVKQVFIDAGVIKAEPVYDSDMQCEPIH